MIFRLFHLLLRVDALLRLLLLWEVETWIPSTNMLPDRIVEVRRSYDIYLSPESHFPWMVSGAALPQL